MTVMVHIHVENMYNRRSTPTVISGILPVQIEPGPNCAESQIRRGRTMCVTRDLDKGIICLVCVGGKDKSKGICLGVEQPCRKDENSALGDV